MPLRVQDWSLCDVEELRRELDCLQEQYEQTVQQRTLIRLEWEDVGLVMTSLLHPWRPFWCYCLVCVDLLSSFVMYSLTMSRLLMCATVDIEHA